MIKRIYYYFKLKELLEKSELMPFVKYLMRLQHRSLFQMCMRTYVIRLWFNSIASYKFTYHDLLPKAQVFTEHAIEAERLTKRFLQSRDIWNKTVQRY